MAAACWICLEEGNDGEGKPPVRDCSCRGDAAGYAHISCIVEYAKVKSKQAKNDADFERAWHICPNCNQQYQNQHRLDLASAFVSFAETTYGYPGRNNDREFEDPLVGDRGKIMAALRVNIETIVSILLERTGMNANCSHGSTILAWDGSFDGASLRVEGEALINKLLSLWHEIKKDKKMGGWVHVSREL